LSSFIELIDQAQSLLEKSGRVSLRVLQREYSLDDDSLEDLVEELVDVREVATRKGNVLQWISTAVAIEPGERRQLTVMFCDLVGSTALAQEVDPEELSEILVQYRNVCDEAVKVVNGHVAQYLGDGVLIYFGYPQAQEDAADRAIRAGLDIQRLLKARYGDRIRARIGIHTGPVVVDRAAAGDKALALGSATNVASRIEGMATPGTVLVSSMTLDNCRGEYSRRSLGHVELKGVEKPIELFEIQAVTKLRSSPGAFASQPILGRDEELAELSRHWGSVVAGQGQTVVLVGEAGMGKSRLVQGMQEQVSSESHLWHDMQCSPFTSGSAFQPLIDLQRSLFGLSESESRDNARDLLVANLESMQDVKHADVIPYLLALLQLPASERYPMLQTSTGEQRERTIKAMLVLINSMTNSLPMVLVLEDVHWADPSTLEFVSRLIDSSANKRLMFLITSRPNEQLPWKQPHVSTIQLAGLSRESTRKMILLAAGGGLPETVLTALEARSDGVPLFIGELTANVVSSGEMIEQNGNYELRASLKELSIPMTLQDSLMARLDRLNTSKMVAQQAATLGREFSYPMIQSIIDVDEPSLISSLEELVYGGILTEHGTHPDTTYTFRHALLQDAAYESQLHSTRRILHAKIVKSLQTRFPLKVQSEPEVIARHCAAAGMHAEAVDYYHRAAALAEKRLSNREAADHYELALNALASLEEDDSRKQREVALRLAQTKAQVAMHGFEVPEVKTNIDRIESICAGIEEGPEQLPALLGLVQLDLAKGDNMNCRDRGFSILEIAEPLGIPFIMGVTNLIIGGTDILTGNSIGGRDRLKRVVDMPELRKLPRPATSNDVELLSTAYTTYGSGLANCAQFEECIAACEAGILQAKEHGNDISIVQALATASLCGYIIGDVEYARDTAKESLALAEGRGFHTGQLMATFPLGWATAHEGDFETALAYVEQGLEITRTTGSVSGIELLLLIGAETHRMAGNRDSAIALIDESSKLSGNRAIGYQAQILRTRARVEISLGGGNTAEAEAMLLEAYELAHNGHWTVDELLTAMELGRNAINTNKAAEAHARLSEVYGRIPGGRTFSAMIEAKAILDGLAKPVAKISSGEMSQ
jgi:class 3 adenylate cyclase/tetratricopeptide (TPR) repeat protein